MMKVQEELFISGEPLGREADEAREAESSSSGLGGCVNEPQNLKHLQGKETENKRGNILKRQSKQ